MSKTKQRARVYSYIRFSTPEQAMGDSERRQVDAAKAYAERLGLQLDDTLDLRDRGLSGYHGDHRRKGALGRFLAVVEAGEVPPGSILLVENVDRLSREGVAATLRQIIFKLWDHGIILQTLSPEETYKPGCENSPTFLALFIYMQRAQDESKRKSDRIRAARNRSRTLAAEEHRILTSRAPAWLTVKDGRFVTIPEAAKTIRLIFDLRLSGVSTRAIERRLNAEAPWTPPPREKARRARGEKGNGWRASYIKKILYNRAVMGEYQPHQRTPAGRVPVGETIPGYYPVVVPPDVFHAVQQMMAANRGNGGRTGKNQNLFRHLVKCAYCGGSMRFVNKGEPPKGAKYLDCDSGYRGVGCARHRVRYDELEATILDNCEHLRPDQVLPNPDEQDAACHAIRQRLAGREAELQDMEQRAANLLDQIERTTDAAIRDRYEARLRQLGGQKQDLERQRADDEAELRRTERNRKSFTKWQRDLDALRQALADGDPELRMRCAAHLRQFIDRIEVFAVGHQVEADPDAPPATTRKLYNGKPRSPAIKPDSDERFADYIDAVLGDAGLEYPAGFLDYVTKRRMSKEGRFYRIHYRTGATLDVVPPGSLATGEALVRDGRRQAGWRFVRPSIDRLLREYGASYAGHVLAASRR